MARARFIRPEFFTDEKVSDLPFGACLLFAGIWCHSDLNGVFEHSPRVLRGLIFPVRDGIDTATVGTWLGLLETAGMIGRFDSDGKSWGFVRNWIDHQQISGREKTIGSRRPKPPTQDHARNTLVTRQEHACAASPTPTPTATASGERVHTPPGEDIFDTEAMAQAKAIMAADAKPKPAIPSPPKSFVDFRAVHGRIFVGRDEKADWEALLRAYEWDAMHEMHETLKEDRIYLNTATAWLSKHYRITE